jgi:hypothetical protein
VISGRLFLGTVAGGLLAAPLAAEAQLARAQHTRGLGGWRSSPGLRGVVLRAPRTNADTVTCFGGHGRERLGGNLYGRAPAVILADRPSALVGQSAYRAKAGPSFQSCCRDMIILALVPRHTARSLAKRTAVGLRLLRRDGSER